MGDIFNVDYQEFIQYLNHAAVEYILVGGYATIIHGYNRTTGDLDIWVHQTEQNYHRLESAFKQFQMPVFDMTLDKFLHDSSIDVFSFGRPPVSIDIITQLKGLEFGQAWPKIEEKVIEGNIKVKVISRKDLISAKKASNRPKDQDDIEHLT